MRGKKRKNDFAIEVSLDSMVRKALNDLNKLALLRYVYF